MFGSDGVLGFRKFNLGASQNNQMRPKPKQVLTQPLPSLYRLWIGEMLSTFVEWNCEYSPLATSMFIAAYHMFSGEVWACREINQIQSVWSEG